MATAYGVRASDQCDTTRIHEEIDGNSASEKYVGRESGAIQMLEELVKKYEEHRDKKYVNDLKLQRLYDILPKPIEQQLVLEDIRVSETKSKQFDNDEVDRSNRDGIGDDGKGRRHRR